MSPSMDILISSNLERLLYFTAGPAKTAAYMASLKETGKYTVEASVMNEIRRHFVGYYADEGATASAIKETYEKFGYLADTHTSVALSAASQYLAETGDDRPLVIDSTASPFKFAKDVYKAITGNEAPSDLAALDLLSEATGVEIPYPLAGLEKRAVRFTEVVEKDEMANAVLAYLNA